MKAGKGALSALMLIGMATPCVGVGAEAPMLTASLLPSFAIPTNHGAGLVELPGGGLLACWYAGTTEANADARILCSRSDDQGGTWAPAYAAVAAGERAIGAGAVNKSVGNVTLYHDGRGRLWMIYGVIQRWDWPILGNLCRNWRCGRVDAKISGDDGRTWSPSVRFDDRIGALPRAKPVGLSDGEDVVPLYLEGAETASLRLLDLTQVPEGSPPPAGRLLELPAAGLIQPAPLVQADGTIRVWLRDTHAQRVFTAVADPAAGRWSPAVPTNLSNPGSAVEAFQDDAGAFVLVYNPGDGDSGDGGRHRLRLARSTDGVTFAAGCDIAVGPGDVAYPSVIRSADGTWHMVYSSDDKGRIRHLRFNAAWLRGCLGE